MEAIDWRCANCGGFHEYGNCPYYEDFNSWNPPHHQYYGEYEHQPFVQEEPHQRQGSGGKKSLREILEGYLTREDENKKIQEATKSIEEMFEEFMIRTEDNLKALSDGNNVQEAKLMQVSAR